MEFSDHSTELQDFQSGPGLHPANRRACPRFDLDEEATLFFVSHGLPLSSRILDLSIEGCRVRCPGTVSTTIGLRVEIAFKVDGIAFRFSGIVQWTNGRNLVGIRFVDMIPRRRGELAEVIDELHAAAIAKAREEAAKRESQQNQPAAESGMQALIESSSPAPAVEPRHPFSELNQRQLQRLAAADHGDFILRPDIGLTERQRRKLAALPLATPTPSRPPASLERRAQQRQAVDTSATLYLVRTGSSLTGVILDLSVTGCRIRTAERFALGIFTRVETGFHADGLPFRIGGVIQAIHDRFTVGIRFIDLSERNSKRLTELIRTIKESRSDE